MKPRGERKRSAMTAVFLLWAALGIGCAHQTASLPGSPARPASAAAEAPQTPPSKVRFQFAWPDQLELHARSEMEKLQGEDESSLRPEVTVQQTSIIRADRAGENLRVRFETTSLDVCAAIPQLTSMTHDIMEAMGNYSIVVDPQGALREVEGVEIITRKMSESLDNIQDPQVKANLQKLLEPMLSPKFQTQAIAKDWDTKIGSLAGKELVAGEQNWAESESETTIPFVGPVRIPYTTEIGDLKSVPCTPEPDAQPCVEVQFRTSPTTQNLKTFLEKALQKVQAMAAQKLPAVEIRDFSTVVLTTLVLEPDTMIPHRVSEQATTLFDLQAELNHLHRINVQKQTTVFTLAR